MLVVAGRIFTYAYSIFAQLVFLSNKLIGGSPERESSTPRQCFHAPSAYTTAIHCWFAGPMLDPLLLIFYLVKNRDRCIAQAWETPRCPCTLGFKGNDNTNMSRYKCIAPLLSARRRPAVQISFEKLLTEIHNTIGRVFPAFNRPPPVPQRD